MLATRSEGCFMAVLVVALVVTSCGDGGNESGSFPEIPGKSVCVEFEPVGSPSPTGPGGCFCWEPPYCWCLFPGGMITAGCSGDDTLCCAFTSTCQPCGWTDVTGKDGPVSTADNSTECRNLLVDMGNWDKYDWRRCVKWENP